jgi:hypothetical protein
MAKKNLESKVEESPEQASARRKLVKYYGYITAAQRIPQDEKTGAMIYGGAPLITYPYQTPITPIDVAKKLMDEDAKSNPELAQFLKDFDDILKSGESIKKYNELYQKYMNESKLSEIVKLGKSLGVKYDNLDALKPYMNKSLSELTKTVKEYAELEQKGELTPEQKVKYYILQENFINLQRNIANMYKSMIESQAEKMQKKRRDYLNDPENKKNIIEFVSNRDKSRIYGEKATKSYESGLAEAA